MSPIVTLLLLSAAPALPGSSTSTLSVEPFANTSPGQASSVPHAPGRMAIANRADGTVSIVDASTDSVTDLLTFPAAANADEAMYCVFAPRNRRLFVGDRGNDRVVAFDAVSLNVIGEAAAGAGVFHMDMTVDESQMWVVNDGDLSLSVFDPVTLQAITTIAIPTDLTDDGGFPHDVFVEGGGDSAFVSIFGLSDGTDVILRYDLDTFAETGRIDCGGSSPHIATSRSSGQLYACVQGAAAVEVYDPASLQLVTSIPVPNAHGIGLGFRDRWIYTVNISGGGPDALHTIDAATNTLVGTAVDSFTSVPHNVATTLNGRKLYLTHSDGTGTKVAVYQIVPPSPVPIFLKEIDAGTNPYGLCAMF